MGVLYVYTIKRKAVFNVTYNLHTVFYLHLLFRLLQLLQRELTLFRHLETLQVSTSGPMTICETACYFDSFC